jgi:hypothetical protein
MRSFEACLHLQGDYVYLQHKVASSMVQLWKLLQWAPFLGALRPLHNCHCGNANYTSD